MNIPTTAEELIEMLKKFPKEAVIVNLDCEPAAVHLDMECEGVVIEVE